MLDFPQPSRTFITLARIRIEITYTILDMKSQDKNSLALSVWSIGTTVRFLHIRFIVHESRE